MLILTMNDKNQAINLRQTLDSVKYILFVMSLLCLL